MRTRSSRDPPWGTPLFISQDPSAQGLVDPHVRERPNRIAAELQEYAVNTSAQGRRNSHFSLYTPTPPYIQLTSLVAFFEHRYKYEVHHFNHFRGLCCPLHCSISCDSGQLASLRCKFPCSRYTSSLLTGAIETMRQHSPRPVQPRCPVYLRGPGLHHEHFLLHRDSMLTLRPTTWVFLISRIIVQTH